MKPVFEKSYNERLFSGGLRSWFHLARFRWLREKCLQYNADLSVVVELGCYDGPAIDYLPAPPGEYYGFDANWEGGLDLARETYSGAQNYHFSYCDTPDGLQLPTGKSSTLTISMETLEHIPPELLPGYLDRLAAISRGLVLVTVPNEKGALFLAKYLVKRFVPGGETYTMSEVVNATLGRMDRVERDNHKGFDWCALRKQLYGYFRPVTMEGVQVARLPARLNAQIGLVLKKS